MKRIERLKKTLAGWEISAAAITDPYNIRYLCGYSGGEGCLYVSDKRSVLAVDPRYAPWAGDECRDAEVMTVKGNIHDAIGALAKEDKAKVVALEGNHLSYNGLIAFRDKLCAKRIISINDEFEKMRAVKDKYELSMIAKAEAIGDAAFDYMLGVIKPGMTEKEVAFGLEAYMRGCGAEGLSFPVIAASGTNSAYPHAAPSDRKLCRGDFLTMDFGCVYNGYCSDMTRTVVIGKADPVQKEIYDIVLSAQEAAISGLCAEMTGAEGDALARNVIENAGYGEYFGHGLGHGVGLYIHESPRLTKNNQDVLTRGMVVTVEPGIYIDGKFGVRIEDAVVIKDDGVLNLTHSDKHLIEL